MPEDEKQQQPDDALTGQKWYVEKFGQAEAEYNPLGGVTKRNGQACATCRWFQSRSYEGGGYGYECARVDNWPAEILPTGVSNKWEERPGPPEVIAQLVQPVVIVPDASVTVIDGDRAQVVLTTEAAVEVKSDEPASTPSPPSTDQRTLGRFPARETLQALAQIEEQGSGFKALGNRLWVAGFTNNFKDRQSETLKEIAHRRYIARVQAGLVEMPDLWHWHTGPASKHGKALWVDRVGHLTYAVGQFDDTPLGQAAEKSYLEAKSGEYTLSHGYFFPRWAFDPQTKDYEDYNTFEITTLPSGAECNPFTPFTVVKEMMEVPLTQEKQNSLRKLFGDQAEGVIAEIHRQETATKEVADAGVAFKDFADVTDQPDDTETANKSNDGDAEVSGLKELLTDLITGQGMLLGEIRKVQGAAAHALTQASAVQKALELPAVPAGEGSTLPEDDKDVQNAQKELDSKDAGIVYDPAYPGMNIPLKQ